MDLFIAMCFGFLLGNAFMVMMDEMAKKHNENEVNKK
jgi:hypothetical protein